MDQETIIRRALSLVPTAIEYFVSETLTKNFPDKALVEGGDGLFSVEPYAQAGRCTLTYRATVNNQIVTHWLGHEMSSSLPRAMAMLRISGMGSIVLQNSEDPEQEIVDRAKNAWFEVQWHGYNLHVLVMNWLAGFGERVYHYWIVADNREIAKEFLAEVCRWNAEIRGEVLVFDGGCWQKDAHLFKAIKGATFDNLILHGNLKRDIREDLQQFFAARETYETYGIPWKRGILFVGPPGNGKTHAVKAIINALEQPCLYVKSFRAERRTDEDNIRQVFERARKTAPCVLVLEDLDSLLNAQNRSFFLNELDGFAANVGVVTIATTNHPERLDPAILDRPSRFDRKYPFDLPELAERTAYINMWNASMQSELRLSEEGVSTLSQTTEGFSYAYLKELFLSSMMRWISNQQQGHMEQVILGQENILREQMASAISQ